jgi:hypothetical protein
MFITSALEQFLLLSDIAYNNIFLLFIKPIIYFIVIIPSQFISEITNVTYTMVDVFYFNDLIMRFNYLNIVSEFSNILENLVFNLINIQYYKLNFFLIFVVSSLAYYTTSLFPKTIFQFVIEKSHIVSQQILKPIFGNHYPFINRFYQYYPFLYHLFLFILFNNLLGLVPYGFQIVHILYII